MIRALLVLFATSTGIIYGNDPTSQTVSPRDVIQKIEKTQQVLNTLSQPAEVCTDCAQLDHPADRRRACAEAICKKTTTKLQEIDSRATENAPHVEAKEEAAQLARIHNLWWEGQKLQNKELAEALANPISTLSPASQRFLASMSFLAHANDVAFKPIVPTGKYEVFRLVDVAETHKALAHLEERERVAIISMGNDFFNRIHQDATQIQAYHIDVLLREKHPGLSRAEAFQREVEVSLKMRTELHANPEFKKIASSLGATQVGFEVDLVALKNEKNPSDAQIRSVIKIRTDLLIAKEVADPNSAFSKLAQVYPTERLTSEENRRKQLSIVQENLSYLADSKNQDRERSRLISKCLAKLTHGVQVLPSEQELKVAEENGKNLIQAVQKKVLPLFSEPTRDKANPIIQKTKFVFPPTADKFRRSFRDHLKTMESVQGQYENTAGEFRVALGLRQQLKTEERSTNFRTSCDDFINRMVSDASYGEAGAIQVGWGSCRDAHFGKFVMGHELGHQLYDIFRKIQMSGESAQRKSTIETCLASKHPGKLGPNGYAMDQQYVSEDWADWIGAEVMDAGDNPWCFRMDFAALKKNEQFLSLMNEFADDKHSSPFFRLIHVEQMTKKELPPGCRQAVTEENPMLAQGFDCARLPALPAGGGLIPGGYGYPATPAGPANNSQTLRPSQ